MTTNHADDLIEGNAEDFDLHYRQVRRNRHLDELLEKIYEHVWNAPPDTEAKRNINFLITQSRVNVVVNIGLYKVLGCAYPSSDRYYGLDLSPFGAYQQGVSRFHAVIVVIKDDVVLIDNDSHLGVYIYGTRVKPRCPYLLKSGDLIRLANLDLKILFDE